MQRFITRSFYIVVFFVLCLNIKGQSNITFAGSITGKSELTASKSITLSPGFHAVSGSDFRAYISTTENAGNPVATTVATVSVSGNASTEQNYIRTIAFREAQAEVPTSAYSHTELIQYFDGLGRPSQTVAVGAAPDGSDLVTPSVYDGFGREAVKYLPYADNGTAGSYRSNAATADIDFYKGVVEGKTSDEMPLSTTVFDNSPLNRIVSVTGSGKDWYDKSKATAYKYLTNTAVVPSWNENGASITYPVASLYITEVTDEDGGITREYKNKLGQVVMKESFDGTTTLRTCYIYDDFGLLRTVVPPMASSPADTELCYFYTYDSRKRMETKKLPGAEIVQMVYDKRDRLVLSQDGYMRAKGKYMFTKYDQLNRAILTGTIAITRVIGDIRKDFADYTGQFYETSVSTTGTYGYTLNNSYPANYKTITATDVLTVFWYDGYSFLTPMNIATGYKYTDYTIPTGFKASTSSLTKGMLTGTLVKALPVANSGATLTDMDLVTVNYYDNYGNPIRIIADNHKGGKNVTSSLFKPVTQEVEQTVSLLVVPGQSNLEITKLFSYDHTGRLLDTKCKVGSGNTIVLNAMRYNVVGELSTKYLHSTNTGTGDKTFVQKIDYTYNIRGWLTAINDPDLSKDNDVFGMALCYNQLKDIGSVAASAGGARYNGNISAIKWNAKGDKLRGYGFGYDGFNRLKKSIYGEGSTLSTNTNAFNENIDGYDANGNMTKLQRWYNGTLADDLTYSYELEHKSNRLKNIVDPMGDIVNVADYVARSAANYTYDANGNMTTDPGKGTTITYNLLNLPECVSFTNGKGKLFYHYDAAGRNLAQFIENNDGGQNKLTDYVGGTVYTDNQLSFAATEEGRIVPDGSGDWRYEYFLKDHLGNTRAVVAGTLVPGSADLLQTTNYYPFGLTMAQNDYNNETTNYHKNRYLYNGKELQSDGFGGVDLDWLDYGARMYDAQIGRWAVIDPLAEMYFDYSPYNYVVNNPVNGIDPDGRSAYLITDPNQIRSFVDFMKQGEEKGPGPSINAIEAFIKLDLNPNDYSQSDYLLPDLNIGISNEGRFDFDLRSYGNVWNAINNYQFGGLSEEPETYQHYLAHGFVNSYSKMWAEMIGFSLTFLQSGVYQSVRGAATIVDGFAAKTGTTIVEDVAVHGNSLKSLKPTWGYKLFSEDGTFLKNGITSKLVPETRYTKAFMQGKYMEAIPFPNRAAAYQWEFEQNLIQRGPLNFNMH